MKPSPRHLTAIMLVALAAAVLPVVSAVAPVGAGAPTLESAPGAEIPLLAGSGVIESYVAPIVEPGESGIALGDAGLTSGEVGTESATIVVNYDANFNNFPPAQVAFQRAIDLWEQLIISPVTIEIDADFGSLGAGVLASAGPDTIHRDTSPDPPNCLPLVNTWYPAALANALCEGDQNGVASEGGVSFNLAFPDYYYGLDGLPGSGKYDFVTVALHEIGHILGFLGSMNAVGSTGTWGGFSGCAVCPMVYDTFAEDGDDTPLLSYTRGTVALNDALEGDIGTPNPGVFFDGTATTAANGGTPAELWAPSSWLSGSSFSHLDDLVYPQGNPNSLMTPIVNDGEAILSPGPVALAMFNDMGWELPVAPDAPTDVTAVRGSNAAKVSVVPPVDDGGSAITSYTVTASPGGATSSGPTPDVWIAGLDNGTPYTFTVTATNAFGTSPPSDPSFGLVTPELHGFFPLDPVRILDTRDPPYRTGLVGDGTGAPPTGPLTPHQVLKVQVAGLGGVPADAHAVVMNVTAVTPTVVGWLKIFPSDEPTPPIASNLNFVAGQTVPNLVTVELGADGKVKVANTDGPFGAGLTHVLFDMVGWYADDGTGSELEPVNPTRILDTRTGVPGLDPRATALEPRETYHVKVAEVGPVPVDATAVAMNVTAVTPTKQGWLTVFPRGQSLPIVSNLNFVAGQTVPNLVTVKIGDDGYVDVNNTGSNAAAGFTHVIFDVVGWYGPTATQGGINAGTPTRILDTRVGVAGANARSTALAPKEKLTVLVAGYGGVPSSGVSAVVMNVTVTKPTSSGSLTVWPSDPMPNASNLNFLAGATVPNLVVVALGPGGTVRVGNSVTCSCAGFTHVIFDVVGWFADTP